MTLICDVSRFPWSVTPIVTWITPCNQGDVTEAMLTIGSITPPALVFLVSSRCSTEVPGGLQFIGSQSRTQLSTHTGDGSGGGRGTMVLESLLDRTSVRPEPSSKSGAQCTRVEWGSQAGTLGSWGLADPAPTLPRFLCPPSSWPQPTLAGPRFRPGESPGLEVWGALASPSPQGARRGEDENATPLTSLLPVPSLLPRGGH